MVAQIPSCRTPGPFAGGVGGRFQDCVARLLSRGAAASGTAGARGGVTSLTSELRRACDVLGVVGEFRQARDTRSSTVLGGLRSTVLQYSSAGGCGVVSREAAA